MVLIGGADCCRLPAARVGLRLVVGVFRNCVWLVNSRSSSFARLRTGLIPLRLVRWRGKTATLPSVGVWMLWSAFEVAGGVGALLIFGEVVVISLGGDGGVGRLQGRFALGGGGRGCVRREGGVAVAGGDVGVEGDAMVEIWWCSIFSVAKSDC